MTWHKTSIHGKSQHIEVTDYNGFDAQGSGDEK